MTERTIQTILTATGLTEAELADLVEGGTISPQREEALRATLVRHPEIAKFFAGIRSDRAAMRVLDQSVRAPAGLLEAVEIRIDQEALRSLSEPVVPAAIPISAATTRIERRNPIAALFERAWVRRLATAASLLLAIGLGVWGTYVGIQNWPQGSGGSAHLTGPDSLAQNTDPPSDLPSLPTPGIDDTLIASSEPTMPLYTALATTSSADGPGVSADGTVLSEAELLDLAAAGRLAIVISGNTAALADRISGLATSGPTFRVSPVADDLVTSSMSPLARAVSREDGIPRSDWAASLRDPWSVRGADAGIPSSRQYLSVASAADPASLRQVLTACGLLGAGSNVPGRTVRVMVLDEPVAQPIATDSASVLWWSASPAKWSRTTTVPVIIEE